MPNSVVHQVCVVPPTALYGEILNQKLALLPSTHRLIQKISIVNEGAIAIDTDNYFGLCKKIWVVAKVVNQTNPAIRVVIVSGNGNRTEFCVSQLLEAFPPIAHGQGILDKELTRMQAEILYEERFEILAQELSAHCAVFVIDVTGIYRYVKYQSGIFVRTPIDSVLNHNMSELMEPETAEFIRSSIEQAYKLGQERTIDYEIRGKQYRSKLKPLSGQEACLVLCERLNPDEIPDRDGNN